MSITQSTLGQFAVLLELINQKCRHETRIKTIMRALLDAAQRCDDFAVGFFSGLAKEAIEDYRSKSSGPEYWSGVDLIRVGIEKYWFWVKYGEYYDARRVYLIERIKNLQYPISYSFAALLDCAARDDGNGVQHWDSVILSDPETTTLDEDHDVVRELVIEFANAVHQCAIPSRDWAGNPRTIV
jgi:hypothetical protein